MMWKVNLSSSFLFVLLVSGTAIAEDPKLLPSKQKTEIEKGESQEFWDSFEVVANTELSVEDLQTLESLRKHDETNPAPEGLRIEQNDKHSTKSKSAGAAKE